MTKPTRRAVVYARISVSSEESVSIERQIEAAEQYAAARGWKLVGTFKDDGVSATHNKPENRAGWRALLASRERFDVVLIWKIDRLARRTLDFLHAHEAVQSRGAGIVGIEDPIDMTTSQGELFATILAAFAKAEADSISTRVKAARTHLVRARRVVGGTVPYGWRSVPNPDGPGLVLAQDPERIEWVRGMVERTRAGLSIYSTVQWLDAERAPTPTGRGSWVYTTVERILRHPVLAGMTPFNPGNATRERGEQVLRGEDGLAVVDESIAVLSVPHWRAMVRQLDERDSAQSRPVALRAKTSGVLSGLIVCGEHDGEPVRMWRGTIQGRPGYYCPSCHHAISNFEHVVVDEFLRQKGEHVRWSVVEEVHEGGAALLPEIELRLSELGAELQATDDDDEADSLTEQIAALRKLRREAREQTPVVRMVPTRDTTQSFGEDWDEADSDEERRAILGDALERIWVRRGRPGRRTDAQVLARLTFDWRMPDDLGPLDAPDDATLASWGAR